MNTTEYLLKCQ